MAVRARYKLPEFDGKIEKYGIWKKKMKTYLDLIDEKELWGLENQKGIKGSDEFKEKNAKLYALLLQSLDDRSLDIVLDVVEDEDGIEVMKVLDNKYEATSANTLLNLDQKFDALTCSDLSKEGSLAEYLRKLVKILRRQQRITGVTFKDSIILAKLARKLPERYRDWGLGQLSNDGLKVEGFITALAEIHKAHVGEGVGSEEQAFLANSTFRGKCHVCKKVGHKAYQCPERNRGRGTGTAQRQTPFIGRCHFCGETGHKKYECAERKQRILELDREQANLASSESAAQINTSLNSSYDDSLQCNCDVSDELVALLAVGNSKNQLHFCVDSGCTRWMINRKEELSNYKQKEVRITIGDGRNICSQGEGTLKITMKTMENDEVCWSIPNVLFVPALDRNLASVREITRQGGTVIFGKHEDYLDLGNGKKIELRREGNLNYMEASPRKASCEIESAFISHNMLKHEQLGHPGRDKTRWYNRLMKKKLGDNFVPLREERDCHTCLKSKSMKNPFRTKSDRVLTAPRQLVYFDFSGKGKKQTREGKNCYGIAVDAYSLFMVARLETNECNGVNLLREWIKYGGVPEEIRVDGAATFRSREFMSVCNQFGIRLSVRTPYTPNQNASAEVAIGVINKLAVALLNQRNVPGKFWGDAVLHAVYILNRTPKPSRSGRIPCIVQSDGRKQVDMSKLKVFGCLAYVNRRHQDKPYGKYRDWALGVIGEKGLKIETFLTRIGELHKAHVGSLNEEEEEARMVKSSSSKFRGRCRNCGGLGHKAVDCRKPRRADSSASRKCYYCGQEGHIKSRCPERKKDIEELDRMHSANIGNVVNDSNDDNTTRIEGYFGARECVHCDDNACIRKLCVDSGCSTSMVPSKEMLEGYKQSTTWVRIGDGSKIKAVGVGTMRVKLVDSFGNRCLLKVDRVLHVPCLDKSLLSVKQLTKEGYVKVVFEKGKGVLQFKGGVSVPFTEEGRLDYLEGTIIVVDEERGLVSQNMLLHEKLGHPGRDKTKAYNKMSVGPKLLEEPTCHACLRGKTMKEAWKKKSDREVTEVNEIVYMDFSGKAAKKGRDGSQCYGIAVDKFSLYKVCILEETEANGVKLLKKWIQEAGVPKEVRVDGAKTFKSNSFKELCEQYNIKWTCRTPYSPNQNATAEISIGVVNRLATTLLNQRKVPRSFWPDSVEHAVQILNRTPLASRNGKIPCEIQSGGKVKGRPEDLKIFGCLVYVHMRKEVRDYGKFGETAEVGMYIGDCSYMPAFKIMLRNRKLIVSRDCKFVEDKCGIDFIAASKTIVWNDDVGSTDDVDGIDLEIEPLFENRNESAGDEVDGGRLDVNDQHGSGSERTPLDPLSGVASGINQTSPKVRRSRRLAEKVLQRKHQPTEREIEIETRDKLSGSVERSIAESSGYQDHEVIGAPGDLYRMEECDVALLTYSQNVSDRVVKEMYEDEMRRKERQIVRKSQNEEVVNSGFYRSITEIPRNLTLLNPRTRKEAMNSRLSLLWRQAEEEELQKLRDWGTFKREVSQRELGNRKSVSTKWVYDIQKNEKGEVQRLRARLVARGFSQIHGLDFGDTYAPVTRVSSVRLLIAVAVQKSYKLRQSDVKSAFLNAKLHESIFLRLPEGYVAEGENTVALELDKALYGLRQAAREWNQMLTAFLEKSENFVKCSHDECIFKSQPGGKWKGEIFIATHVDDMISAAEFDSDWNQFEKDLRSEYQLKDVSEVKWFLKVHITQDLNEGIVELDQERYVEALLERFGLEDANPRFQPLPSRLSYMEKQPSTGSIEEKELLSFRKVTPYKQLVGALLHLARYTRPDIQFAVSYIARYCSCFSKNNWSEAKHILRYLKATKGAKLRYSKGAESMPFGYVDADWASDVNDRISVTGYAFVYAGAVVSWASRKQNSQSMSSTEAEYMAMSEAAQEAVYLRNILEFFQPGINRSPTVVLCDSKGARDLARNPTAHKRTKHIDIRYHYVRHVLQEGKVKWVSIASTRNVADAFTKSLGRLKISEFRKGMGIVNTRESSLNKGERRRKIFSIPWELKQVRNEERR